MDAEARMTATLIAEDEAVRAEARRLVAALDVVLRHFEGTTVYEVRGPVLRAVEALVVERRKTA
jgi:hypothetical protein